MHVLFCTTLPTSPVCNFTSCSKALISTLSYILSICTSVCTSVCLYVCLSVCVCSVVSLSCDVTLAAGWNVRPTTSTIHWFIHWPLAYIKALTLYRTPALLQLLLLLLLLLWDINPRTVSEWTHTTRIIESLLDHECTIEWMHCTVTSNQSLDDNSWTDLSAAAADQSSSSSSWAMLLL